MSGQMEKINSHIETLSLEVVTLEENDIPGMGQILNTICSLEAECEGMGEMILSRDDLIPLIRLRLDRIFGVNGDYKDPWNGLVVAVEHDGEKRCLLFDEILGKEEVVIKSLGESLKETKGIAGGAIIGDGRVGLILDIPGVIEVAKSN